MHSRAPVAHVMALRSNGLGARRIARRPDLPLSTVCRSRNTGRGNWVCPRYAFYQVSTDIQEIFCSACEAIGVHWTKAGARTIYVSRKADVALLDTFIGPKR
jgi:hypothetical protein